MEFILKNPRLTAAIIGMGIVLTMAVVSLQVNLTAVSATIIPVLVSEDHLDFNGVFPGEHLEGNFVVSLSEEYEGDGVNYKIIQKRKPLPPEHPEFPDGGDPFLPGFYRDLCPHLEKISNEGEGDQESGASIGPNDTTDAWVINFQVPAIFGTVGQEHIGGVVTVNGEYGCDVSIDIIEEPQP